MGLATCWAIFSQTYVVTLLGVFTLNNPASKKLNKVDRFVWLYRAIFDCPYSRKIWTKFQLTDKVRLNYIGIFAIPII
jgi:hypothetical protein